MADIVDLLEEQLAKHAPPWICEKCSVGHDVDISCEQAKRILEVDKELFARG